MGLGHPSLSSALGTAEGKARGGPSGLRLQGLDPMGWDQYSKRPCLGRT